MNNSQTLVIGLVGIVSALLSAVSAYLIPHIPLVWQISLGVAVVCFIAYAFVERLQIKKTFAKRTARYGMNSVFMAVIALFIAIFLNLIAKEYDFKADLTKNKLNSLSDETVKVLTGLEEDVTMKAFLNPNQVSAFEKVFDKYAYHTNRLKKEYVDVDQDPMAVNRYKVKTPGTIIFETANRVARVENLRGEDDPKLEEKLTNAIIKVAKGDKRKIYFLKGHGERSVEDRGKDGYSEIKETLEAGRYQVEELLLIDKEAIPEDAEIIIVAGPKSAMVEHEVKLLKKYVESGKPLFVMVDPRSTATIQPLAARLGVSWTPKKAIYESNPLHQMYGGNALMPIVTSYDRNHEITKENKTVSIYPEVAPVDKAKNPPKGVSGTTLFSTSRRSLVAEIQGNRLKVDQKTARKGPVPIALAVTGKLEQPKAEKKDAKADEKKDEAAKDPAAEAKQQEAPKEFRAVVVGDSDFAANGYSQFGINADIFQNMLSWLAQEEDLISIRPKPQDSSSFDITDARMRIINLASVAVLPILMFLSGLVVWFTRRRR